ncbi:MAG: hypothetical protein HYY31_03075 [Chloroflexi bacterium]|nr:hypothetical protein [Chloroflexota bacterium]
MSRRRDRDRIDVMRRLDPGYPGFRGPEKEPTRPGNLVLVSVVCSICQRKRNIPPGMVPQRTEEYVCLSCREKQSHQSGERAPGIPR